MNRHPLSCLPLLATALLLAGCASTGTTGPQPVLYPNAAFKTMGETAARQHLDQCVAQARQSGLNSTESAASGGALRGAAVAGVSGAVGSLVFGRGLDDAVKRGAQSAVVGAAAGGTAGAMSERSSSTYRQFVQRCAAEKGLDVIGWN